VIVPLSISGSSVSIIIGVTDGDGLGVGIGVMVGGTKVRVGRKVAEGIGRDSTLVSWAVGAESPQPLSINAMMNIVNNQDLVFIVVPL
jgi:hypothetical protein